MNRELIKKTKTKSQTKYQPKTVPSIPNLGVVLKITSFFVPQSL